MNKHLSKIFIIFLFLILPFPLVSAQDLSSKLSGRILLQVESNGEAWYVNPDNLNRYFLGRPADAFQIMQELGIGISNENLKKIPIGYMSAYGVDSDGDGLRDGLELAIGTSITSQDSDGDYYNDKEEIDFDYNPTGPGKLPIDPVFTRKVSGKILLQVEQNGEAWYVYPEDNKRYFLGRPEDAFNVMRSLGLGISNSNISRIGIFSSSVLPQASENNIEKRMHNLVNEQRRENGLVELAWNEEVAAVAREHSANLAQENEPFTVMGARCDYPMIHHEGFDFGLYHDQRLNNRGVYYFNKSAENIALVPRVSYLIILDSEEDSQAENERCQNQRQEFNNELNEINQIEDEEKIKDVINDQIEKRTAVFESEEQMNIEEEYWTDEDELAGSAVIGWMNSEGHRKNILDGDYTEAGIGIANINGYIIATQVFISRVSCGYKYGVCCQKEGYYPYCYEPYDCQNNICQN